MLTTAKPKKKTLPILNSLDDVRIASPCTADWDGMTPVTDQDGARARFCGSCEKNVYDLSAMTRADAMSLIERHEGRCCVRFYQRHDGTVLTEDCPVGVRALLKRAERRALLAAAAGVGAVAAVIAALIGASNPVSRKAVCIKEAIVEATPDPIAEPLGSEPPVQPMMGGMPPPRPHVEPPARPIKMGKIKAPPRALMGDIGGPTD